MYCDWPILGRCCFCMPLRRGILTFGYLNLFFSAFLVGVYSYTIHTGYNGMVTIYHGAGLNTEVCLALYCLEIVFNAILIYGAHMKIMSFIRVFYYFSLMTVLATVLIEIIAISDALDSRWKLSFIFEFGPLMFASLFIEIYLIILVRSLLRKMDMTSGTNVYDNPLQQFVYDGKVDANGVYDSTTVPVEV